VESRTLSIEVVLTGLYSKRAMGLGVQVSSPKICLSNDEKYQYTVMWELRHGVFRQLGPGSSCIGELVKKTRVMQAGYNEGTLG